MCHKIKSFKRTERCYINNKKKSYKKAVGKPDHPAFSKCLRCAAHRIIVMYSVFTKRYYMFLL